MATTALRAQNWFSTTLSSSISASDTTINLNSVPTNVEGYLVIEPDSSTNREVIYFTSKTSSAVVLPSAGAGRGQDGTSATSHASGASVKLTFVNAYWDALRDGTGVADGAITPAKLTAGTGTSWAWQSWTPTWTNLTVGNGTLTAKYTQFGKTVHCELMLVFGSSTSITGTAPTFTLPVTANSRYNSLFVQIGIGFCEDVGNAGYPGISTMSSSNPATGRVDVLVTNQTYSFNSAISSTIPFTWGTGDKFVAVFDYEAA